MVYQRNKKAKGDPPLRQQSKRVYRRNPVCSPVQPGQQPACPACWPVNRAPTGRQPEELQDQQKASGLWPGQTGLYAGLSGLWPGQPGLSSKNAEVASGNGQILKNTINTPSPILEGLDNILQAVLELSLSYSIIRNTKSLRSPSSSTQTQIPPGNH